MTILEEIDAKQQAMDNLFKSVRKENEVFRVIQQTTRSEFTRIKPSFMVLDRIMIIPFRPP